MRACVPLCEHARMHARLCSRARVSKSLLHQKKQASRVLFQQENMRAPCTHMHTCTHKHTNTHTNLLTHSFTHAQPCTLTTFESSTPNPAEEDLCCMRRTLRTEMVKKMQEIWIRQVPSPRVLDMQVMRVCMCIYVCMYGCVCVCVCVTSAVTTSS
jgi:hypothetical protein